MVQKSESAAKPVFLYGHFFSAVGILIGNAVKSFCLPLSVQIHGGDEIISQWEGDESVSHLRCPYPETVCLPCFLIPNNKPLYIRNPKAGKLPLPHLSVEAEAFQPLQFVLVKDGEKQVILVSTDLPMSAEDIILVYACRFKIEAMFREFKQQFGGLFYHFWTKAVPKLNRYRKKDSSDPFLQVTDTKEKERILKTLKATEGYVLFASIAMGIIQMLCLNYEGIIDGSKCRYLRMSKLLTVQFFYIIH